MRPSAPIALVFALWATTAGAQQNPQQSSDHVIVATPDKLTWGPAPTILPPGAELTVMEGDPTRKGAFTMRLKMPNGYRIPPHSHPFVEHVTVIRGTFRVGMGDRFDASKLTDLQAGTFAALGPGVKHFAEAKGETVLQLHGQGPWTLTYVNPADDPRKTTP
jgi:quercetin dioxygenase-like cupin family protein